MAKMNSLPPNFKFNFDKYLSDFKELSPKGSQANSSHDLNLDREPAHYPAQDPTHHHLIHDPTHDLSQNLSHNLRIDAVDGSVRSNTRTASVGDANEHYVDCEVRNERIRNGINPGGQIGSGLVAGSNHGSSGGTNLGTGLGPRNRAHTGNHNRIGAHTAAQ